MRDYIGPVNLVCHQIPRSILSNLYHIMLPLPREGEDENRPPTSVELCATYAYARGFMTHKGIPDGSRAARLILKDYVNGKLLYCYPPPDHDSEQFQEYSIRFNLDNNKEISNETTSKQTRFRPSDVDQQFFHPSEVRVGSKGINVRMNYTKKHHPMVVDNNSNIEQELNNAKPWKKHHNRNKKEKLRRIYRHLDA